MSGRCTRPRSNIPWYKSVDFHRAIHPEISDQQLGRRQRDAPRGCHKSSLVIIILHSCAYVCHSLLKQQTRSAIATNRATHLRNCSSIWLTHWKMCYRAKFTSSTSAGVWISRGNPQIGERWDLAPWDTGRDWLCGNTPPYPTCYLPKFGRSGSSGTSVITEIRRKKMTLAPSLSGSLKVIGTEAHRSATYDFLLTFHSNLSRTVSEINGEFSRKAF